VKYHLQVVGFPLQRRRRAKRNQPVEPDPLYMHFPFLTAAILSQGEGILAARVLEKMGDATLLQGWSVKMRYRDHPATAKVRLTFERWRAQTQAIFAESGL
jgi:hypothetical protein